ncbi:MAG: hypothetical protein GY885_07690 [Phycisphaeraceae bacterium]|nr:hypothetical protein [Phycisphaeraceae bacterium]
MVVEISAIRIAGTAGAVSTRSLEEDGEALTGGGSASVVSKTARKNRSVRYRASTGLVDP